jgi:hypothetical protein
MFLLLFVIVKLIGNDMGEWELMLIIVIFFYY